MSPMPAKALSETRRSRGLTLLLTTLPEVPKAGENVLRLNLTDQAGKPVTNANVLFVYTIPPSHPGGAETPPLPMAMPGMSETKAPATHTKEGVYEAKALLGMAGTWDVTVQIVVPGRPSLHEKFSFAVAGGM
jgi:Cu(I)/Ag(I) efflux system membrane fusion protein